MQTRITKSRFIRESLEKALRQPSNAGVLSCYDVASDLAGSLTGLPEDLAINPTHMDSFGQ